MLPPHRLSIRRSPPSRGVHSPTTTNKPTLLHPPISPLHSFAGQLRLLSTELIHQKTSRSYLNSAGICIAVFTEHCRAMGRTKQTARRHLFRRWVDIPADGESNTAPAALSSALAARTHSKQDRFPSNSSNSSKKFTPCHPMRPPTTPHRHHTRMSRQRSASSQSRPTMAHAALRMDEYHVRARC
jgi:hypothetical protein